MRCFVGLALVVGKYNSIITNLKFQHKPKYPLKTLTIYLEGFWFLYLEDFLKVMFLHGEIFEFS